jgi:2-aminoadipate transaminase
MPEGVTWTEPAGGFLTWMTLPDGLDSTALRADAIAACVAYVPGTPFFVDGGGACTLRLSFSHLAGPDLAIAAERLGRVVRAALDRVPQHTTGG